MGRAMLIVMLFGDGAVGRAMIPTPSAAVCSVALRAMKPLSAAPGIPNHRRRYAWCANWPRDPAPIIRCCTDGRSRA